MGSKRPLSRSLLWPPCLRIIKLRGLPRRIFCLANPILGVTSAGRGRFRASRCAPPRLWRSCEERFRFFLVTAARLPPARRVFPLDTLQSPARPSASPCVLCARGDPHSGHRAGSPPGLFPLLWAALGVFAPFGTSKRLESQFLGAGAQIFEADSAFRKGATLGREASAFEFPTLRRLDAEALATRSHIFYLTKPLLAVSCAPSVSFRAPYSEPPWLWVPWEGTQEGGFRRPPSYFLLPHVNCFGKVSNLEFPA